MTHRIAFKTCNLCEAMCGLRIGVAENRVIRIEADADDPLSHGHICPKAIALDQIQQDPDRLKQPLRRTATGWEEIGWDEAFEEASRRLGQIQIEHGDDAVASYLGNPAAHNFGLVMYLVPLYQVLNTRNRYSASSLDQNPKHATSLLLYGNFLSIAVPDIDHTDFMLMLGANPVVSGGSLMTAPGFKRRVRALHDRGGELVVVDPRRSETAELADEHIALAPGHDAWLLAALLNTIFDEGLTRDRGAAVLARGIDALRAAIAPFRPERIAPLIGLTPEHVRGLARRFARAERAVCYGRIGTCTQQHGTLASWLIDVLNIVTGNLDHRGGALFPEPAVDLPGLARWRGSLGSFGLWRTRVRNAPAFNDEQPTACLAEEITTPGPGQVRGLITIAGNPALSAPNAPVLDAAIAGLDYHVAIDFYVNETTRHADLILPPTWSLEHENYEVLFHGFAVRNTSKLSPKVIEPEGDTRDDWQIVSELATRLGAMKAGPLGRFGWNAARRMGLIPKPERVLDWALRVGPHGDGFRPWRRGIRRRDLEAAPHGLDLGPLAPRLPENLDTEDRRIDVGHPMMMEALVGLSEDRPATLDGDALWLIGRREVRTNNTWLHNTEMSAKGRDRCTVRLNPADAEKRGLTDGERVRVRSRVGKIEAVLEVRDELMPGIVSVPHGWGHNGPGLRLSVASKRPGVNCNDLTDDSVLEPIVGNAIYTGVPVHVESAETDPRDHAVEPCSPQETRTPS